MDIIWDRIQHINPDKERDSEYGQAWTEGMHTLGQAQESNSTEIFERAALAFLEALKHDPQGYDALIGLTYWLILMGDELSAIHYAQKAREVDPKSVESVELLDLLESSHLLSSLMDDVDSISQGAGFEFEHVFETLSPEEADEVLGQTELLLRIHHLLLTQELKLGCFLKLEHLHSRQLSLEALHQLLKDHLGKFLEDPQSSKQLQQRLNILSYDLESLGKLEAKFEEMHQLQKDVQLMFRDLTREIIRLRMKGKTILAESQTEMIRLELKRQTLEQELLTFEPEPLQQQVKTVSGWDQLTLQLQQFRKMVHELSPQ